MQMYHEHAIAPDSTDRDDATWRFITHGWMMHRQSPVSSQKAKNSHKVSDKAERVVGP